MYLLAYRNLGIFQENVVNRVLRDVVAAVRQPVSATVIGDSRRAAALSTLVTATWKARVESAELIALLHEVRDRVRARAIPRRPAARCGYRAARPDAAGCTRAMRRSAKWPPSAPSNPRPGGVVNSLVQAWKRMVCARARLARARAGGVQSQDRWRASTRAHRSDEQISTARWSALGSRIAAQEKIGEELKDIRNHWAEWRFEWERKLQQNEMQFLRSVADLQGGFQHRATLMDANYRDAVRGQHTRFRQAPWSDSRSTYRSACGPIWSAYGWTMSG